MKLVGEHLNKWFFVFVDRPPYGPYDDQRAAARFSRSKGLAGRVYYFRVY